MCVLSRQVRVRKGEWVQVSNYNVGISRRCWGKRSALCAVEGWVGDCSHPPPVFTRLATKRRSLPKGKSANHPVEFLRQRNSVSRTTYNLTISHGHTRRLPRLLSHKPLRLQIHTKSQINRPTSTTHPLSSSQDIFRPTTAVNTPTLYSTESRAPSPAGTSHAHFVQFVIRYLYQIPFPHARHSISIHTHVLSMVLYFVIHYGTTLYVLCPT